MTKEKVKQKELIAKVNQKRKKERNNFLKQMEIYLEEARSLIALSKDEKKKDL